MTLHAMNGCNLQVAYTHLIADLSGKRRDVCGMSCMGGSFIAVVIQCEAIFSDSNRIFDFMYCPEFQH